MDNENNPENIEALYEFLLPKRKERMEEVLNQRTNHLTILLDCVQNYHNISAVLRSADAFGLCDVHLIGQDIEYSKGIALGTEQWLKLHLHENAKQALDYLQAKGYKIVVTAPEDNFIEDKKKSIPIYNLPFQEKLVIAFGNERAGVSQEIFQAATYKTFIPMFGFVESLNISVACALCLFCSTFEVRSGKRQVPLLLEEEKQKIKEQWVMQTLPHSKQILREVSKRRTNKIRES